MTTMGYLYNNSITYNINYIIYVFKVLNYLTYFDDSVMNTKFH